MSSRAYDKQADGLRPKVIIEWNGTARWFELSTQIVVPNGREQIFDFFSDAFQLELITPEWLKFRILTPSPIRMGAGCLIDYCIHLHGLPVRWRTEISSWDPPFSFTDRQISGPYRMWEHFHSFEQIEDGTVVRDRVCYRVPGGHLVHRLLVQKDLRRIFQYRGRKLLELFPAEDVGKTAAGAGLPESIG